MSSIVLPTQLSRAVTQLGLEMTHFPTFATMGTDLLGDTETPEDTMYISEATRLSDVTPAAANKSREMSQYVSAAHTEVRRRRATRACV